jgi:outer membrane beta-barrel protein
MRFLVAIACLVAVASPALGADEQPGLDLSQPPDKDAAPKGDDEELPPLDLSKPAEPPNGAKATGPKAEEKPRAFVPFSEKDVALGDKVKAVQRKGFLKKGRFEFAPEIAATVNDAFYEKIGYGGRIAYNFQDAFALSVRGMRYVKFRSDNVREGKLAFQSQLVAADIEQQLMLDGIWSPIYGKASFRQHDIVHFDLYLSAGFGLVWSTTSNPPLDQGAHLATDFGGGVRFYPKEWLAFDLGLLATLYPDQPIEQLPATVQKVFVANVGVSFFWPFSFEYVHP